MPERSLGAVTALLGKACELGDATACVGAAVVSNHLGGKAELPRVIGLLERACELEIGVVCQLVAEAYQQGVGVKQDLARANLLLETACGLGSGRGCTALGLNFSKGQGVPEDWKRANELFEQGCDLGDGRACNELGIMFEYARGVAKDMVRASALFDKACDLDEPPACVEIGYLHATGDGALQDWARANFLYEKACRLGNGIGCSNLGFSYEGGTGVAQDWRRANELYAQGCELGSGKACSNLGNNYARGAGTTKDIKKSYELHEKACDLGKSGSCALLGEKYAAGEEVPKDPGRAASFFERACALDLREGCLGLLAARWTAKDSPGSIEALTILARRWPESLSTINHAVVLRAMGASFAGEAKEKRFRLLETIYEAGWRPPVESDAHWAWRDLARMLLERGRDEHAARVATLVTDVDVLISMRVDSRFDAIVQGDPERYDIARALASQLQRDREASAKAPRSLRHLQALLGTLLKAGRAEEALGLADEAIARAGASAAPPFDDADKLNWIKNARSDAIWQLGRWQQAVEELERAGKLTEDGHLNVSQRINLAGRYCAVDRPRDALSILESVGEMSNYGAMALRSVQLRAAIGLGDTAAAAAALAWIRDHHADAEDVFQRSLIYAGRLDEAARVLIAYLKDPDQRTEALVSVQEYLPTPMTQRQREWGARWNQVRARSDVRAAITSVGRVERFGLVN